MIDKNLEDHEWQVNRKREVIYKNWHLNVYEPIKNEINSGMMSKRADLIRNLRNLKYLEYLNQVNKYGAAYQEDFDTLEYDPTCDGLLNFDVCVQNKLKDPTLLASRKNHTEQNVMYKCLTGHELTKKQADQIKLPIIRHDQESRDNIEWKDWILEEFNSIDSSVRARSALKCNPVRHMTKFNIDPEKNNLLNAQLSV